MIFNLWERAWGGRLFLSETAFFEQPRPPRRRIPREAAMPLPNPAPTLADHLHALTDHLADFRNTVDSPQRRNLLGALRAVEQEARARDVALADSAAANAAALARLPSAGQLAEAIGIREIVGAGPYEALDHRWAESVLNYYQTGNNRVAFPTHLGLGINPLRNLWPTAKSASRWRATWVPTRG